MSFYEMVKEAVSIDLIRKVMKARHAQIAAGHKAFKGTKGRAPTKIEMQVAGKQVHPSLLKQEPALKSLVDVQKGRKSQQFLKKHLKRKKQKAGAVLQQAQAAGGKAKELEETRKAQGAVKRLLGFGRGKVRAAKREAVGKQRELRQIAGSPGTKQKLVERLMAEQKSRPGKRKIKHFIRKQRGAKKERAAKMVREHKAVQSRAKEIVKERKFKEEAELRNRVNAILRRMAQT